MYNFVTGPLAWLSFGIFFIGILIRVIFYIKGLDWKLDRVTYGKNISYGLKDAIKSVVQWLIPFGTRSWRTKPIFSIVFFLFHIGILLTPICLIAHNIMFKDSWGLRFPTISDSTADFLTISVILCAVFIILRRIALPEVRIITKPYDLLVLSIAIAPFITGYIASHFKANYEIWLIAHILCGEIMLIAIPFTKLSHFVLYFCSRAQLGMDFGIKRGGMKRRYGFPW